MATWPTISTPLTGTVVTSAWGNNVTTAANMAGVNRPRCRYSRTIGAGGPIGPSGGAISDLSGVGLDTVVFDNDGMAFGNRVNINTAGVWLLTLTAEWVNNGGGGNRSIEMWEGSGSRHLAPEMKVGQVGYSTYHYLTALEILDTSDYIIPRVAQSSGSNAYFYPGGYWGLCISAILVSG
jgi:hypothetical protein